VDEIRALEPLNNTAVAGVLFRLCWRAVKEVLNAKVSLLRPGDGKNHLSQF